VFHLIYEDLWSIECPNHFILWPSISLDSIYEKSESNWIVRFKFDFCFTSSNREQFDLLNAKIESINVDSILHYDKSNQTTLNWIELNRVQCWLWCPSNPWISPAKDNPESIIFIRPQRNSESLGKIITCVLKIIHRLLFLMSATYQRISIQHFKIS